MTSEIRCAIELREDSTRESPGRIQGVLIELGRVAGDRREVFTPASIRWPANGIRLLAEHRGRMVTRFEPVVEGSEIRIDHPLPDTALGREVAAEVRAGRRAGCRWSSTRPTRRGCRAFARSAALWSMPPPSSSRPPTSRRASRFAGAPAGAECGWSALPMAGRDRCGRVGCGCRTSTGCHRGSGRGIGRGSVRARRDGVGASRAGGADRAASHAR